MFLGLPGSQCARIQATQRPEILRNDLYLFGRTVVTMVVLLVGVAFLTSTDTLTDLDFQHRQHFSPKSTALFTVPPLAARAPDVSPTVARPGGHSGLPRMRHGLRPTAFILIRRGLWSCLLALPRTHAAAPVRRVCRRREASAPPRGAYLVVFDRELTCRSSTLSKPGRICN